MDRRDFLLSGTIAAAAVSGTSQALAQNNVPADPGIQQPAYSTGPYEGAALMCSRR